VFNGDRAAGRRVRVAQFCEHVLWAAAGAARFSFIDANDLSASLAAKLDFAGPSVEALNAYR
jgi:hypothetical protein